MKCTHPFETLFGGICQLCGGSMDEIVKELQVENKRLEKTLKWYADENNYIKPTDYTYPQEVIHDNGQKARDAVKAGRK